MHTSAICVQHLDTERRPTYRPTINNTTYTYHSPTEFVRKLHASAICAQHLYDTEIRPTYRPTINDTDTIDYQIYINAMSLSTCQTIYLRSYVIYDCCALFTVKSKMCACSLELVLVAFILILPFLYESSKAFRYYLKFFVYYGIVMTTAVVVIPIMICRPKDVKNLL